jgi:ornithine cyclodeaminase
MVSIIQQQQIDALNISSKECIEWVKQGFLMKDDAQMPAKLSVHPQGEDFMTSMPCLLPKYNGRKYFGLKLVSRIEGQTPTLKSDITLYDAETGQLLAIMDGDWITAMRTGAVAALAARTFQRKDVDTYSMIGLGNIARAVALCLIADNEDRHITIRLMRYKDQAEQFIERFKGHNNVTFEIIDNPTAFLSEADVVISCVTVATELLFPDNSLYKKGVTVIPVHVRGFQNCDLFFDKVFGDDTGQIQTWKYFNQFHEYDEIHHVLQGKNPGRTNDDERILSYNYGLALHDIVFASKIYEKAINTSQGFEYQKQDKKTWV